MKDRIVYIGSNIPDKSPAGVRVFANALALKDYGYDVKLISKDKEYQSVFDQNEGIDTWHFPIPRSTKEWMSSLINSKPFTKIIEEIGDVKTVIAYELPAIAFLRLRRFCKQRGIKLICETAEWQKWENLGHLGFVARTVRLLDIDLNMHFAYKKADAVIVTSHYFADHFKDSLPVLTLPTLQCHKLDKRNAQISHPRKFIYAGGLGYKKDMLVEIIQAFSELSDREFEFNILGLSKEQFAERFADKIPIVETINREKVRVRFWGKVSHAEVLDELKRSDFSLIIRQNSHRNNVGFPTKFGESINCGTPVIVSDFSDVVDYTKLYNVGIVTDVANIKNGIQKALDMDDDALQQMKERCWVCDAFYFKGNVKNLGEFVNLIAK